MISTYLRNAYPESKFGGFSRVDGTVEFYTRIRSLLKPTDTILDVGCGRGWRNEDECEFRRNLQHLSPACKTVIGIDIDQAAQYNPWIDEFRLINTDGTWPIEDESINLVFSDCVIEHLEQPKKFFSECFRVLKPGGYLCSRTPNYFGYVAIISRIVPNRLHSSVLNIVQTNRESQDVFETFYRCNSRRKINQSLRELGFESVVYAIEGEPHYFAFSSTMFYAMTFIHSWLPSCFRSTLLLFAQKKRGN